LVLGAKAKKRGEQPGKRVCTWGQTLTEGGLKERKHRLMVLGFINIKSLLLENKTVRQTVIKNTFWLGIAETVSRVLRLVLVIYVARILGATEYGKFTFSLAFISLFLIFYEFGLPLIITREFAGEKNKEEEFYSLLSLKFILSLGTLILILLGSFFVTPDRSIREIILILSLFSLTSSFLGIFYAFFQAGQRMEYQAGAVILQSTIVTFAGIFVLLNFPSVRNLSYSYLFSSLAALSFVLFFFHLKILP
jgi:polysaccharide transporter, PST family